jgi:uncharacterized coiled-coil DUF342 family protein
MEELRQQYANLCSQFGESNLIYENLNLQVQQLRKKQDELKVQIGKVVDQINGQIAEEKDNSVPEVSETELPAQ